MPVNEYQFVSRWRVEGTANEVADVIENGLGLPRWWPSVYLDVQEIEPGGEHGVGKVISVHAKGWLPYTLRIQFRTVESRYPHGFTLQASGDLEGVGVWTFAQDGAYVNVTYDWRIRARKPLISALSFLLKPLFASNHRWTMARGEESLRLELARRRAGTTEEATRIPAPPGPTFPHNLRRRGRG